MNETDLKARRSYRVWTEDTVRFRDLDPNTHVNHGAINEFFEDGRVRLREEHLAHLGKSVLSGFALVRYVIEYHAPLFFPCSVDVGTTLLRVGRTSYMLGQAVFHGERCIASAEVTTVRIDPESHRARPLDPGFVEALEDVTGFHRR